jgi:hypothetical protein
MTEEEWCRCAVPAELITALGLEVSKRKLLLLACACCYRAWALITDRRGQDVLTAAEQFADGLIDADRLAIRVRASENIKQKMGDSYAQFAASAACYFAALRGKDNVVSALEYVVAAKQYGLAEAAGMTPSDSGFESLIKPVEADELAQQTARIRDIFGNPFRPVTFSPSWRTDPAVALAQQMYDSRDFGAMPILADALQDAGCDSEDILSHCRDTNATHVRGCWVVDMVLSKE